MGFILLPRVPRPSPALGGVFPDSLANSTAGWPILSAFFAKGWESTLHLVREVKKPRSKQKAANPGGLP